MSERTIHFVLVIMSILNDSLRPVKILLIAFALAAASHVFLQHNADYYRDFNSVMPWWAWFSVFILQALLRGVGLFYFERNKILQWITPSIGIWMWSMLFSSSAIMTTMEGPGILYAVIILAEVWILARAITTCKTATADRRVSPVGRRV